MKKDTRSGRALALNRDSLRLVAASDLIHVHGRGSNACQVYPGTEYVAIVIVKPESA